MAGQNERITENLVRDMLRKQGYYDNKKIIVDEQKSNNPKVNLLLKNASKSGTGVGKPEFIISFADDTSFLIVIECKANISDHESKTRDNYKDYAVDGVLHYSDALSKEFNVISIAVSGQNKKELKISHFIQFEKGHIYQPLDDMSSILSIYEYRDIFGEKTKPIKDEKLIKKAVEYNRKLHEYAVPEKDRATILNAMLTAIQDKAFIVSYRQYEKNEQLVKAMLHACENVLEKSKIKSDYKDIIMSEFDKVKQAKFLTSETLSLSDQDAVANTILKDFIKDLHETIAPYMKDNNFDILGRFYRESIRYAGSDGKTGLVLTPSHITEFFCELAELKYNDVVIDPCCGTGGFLVSAMKFMLKDCNYKSEETDKVKAERIIGVELRPDMFSYAYSNMTMRGDGKSNIISGSCFDKKILNEVKKMKPTKALLNPPYRKNLISEQLKFIENALDCLEKSGLCIAICQMSTVTSTEKSNKETIEIRKRLLENHTLRGVISMPSDLFYPIGVVTCILIFEAHKSHPKNKEVFFGYFKDDGYENLKHRGRIDNGTWEEKKNAMLNLYINNNSQAGLAITKSVIGEDEWCAEAHMETDYSQLTESEFAQAIKEYVAFQFLNESHSNETDRT